MHRGVPDELNAITGEIVDSAMRVHSFLGPGLLESAYVTCLSVELRKRGLQVELEVPVPIVYEGVEVECAYRVDMLVNRCVIVEAKAVQQLHPVHSAQVLTHVKLTGHPVGLLINFNEVHLRDGIKRMING